MRTVDVFDSLRVKKSTAFIGYLPAGFPTVEKSIEAVRTLADSGADIIEIGLPYSDPTMDGLTIQQATEESLAHGFRTRDIFSIVEACADSGALPLVMSYYNPLFKYGFTDFARDLDNAGGAGIITPDLVPEEACLWYEASDAYNLDRIFLAAQTSTSERLKKIVKASRGFVYAASTMGVTGTRVAMDERARGLVKRVREAGADNVCLGIGVSTSHQAKDVASYADGVIVGSALVKTLMNESWSDSLESLKETATMLSLAIHENEK